MLRMLADSVGKEDWKAVRYHTIRYVPTVHNSVPQTPNDDQSGVSADRDRDTGIATKAGSTIVCRTRDMCRISQSRSFASHYALVLLMAAVQQYTVSGLLWSDVDVLVMRKLKLIYRHDDSPESRGEVGGQ